jgi:hypothetical protein
MPREHLLSIAREMTGVKSRSYRAGRSRANESHLGL